MITATVTNGSLPAGFCKTDWQTLLNTFSSLLTVTFPISLSVFNYGDTIPTADQQAYPWLRLDAQGNPDKWYVFSNTFGLWVSKHPMPPGAVMLYDGTMAALNLADGGDAIVGGNALITGPMWEVIPNLSGRFPLQPNGTTHTEGEQGGEETHVLTEAEMPEHSHPTLDPQRNFGVVYKLTDSAVIQPEFYANNLGYFPVRQDPTTGTCGSDTAHNNLPPYYGINFARRTARLYYVI